MLPKSNAAEIVAKSLAAAKPTRNAAGEAAANLACRYYECIIEQLADLTLFYGNTEIYGKGSDWHTTRPKSAFNLTRAIVDTLERGLAPVVEFKSPADKKLWDEYGGGFNAVRQNIRNYTRVSGMVAARPILMPDEKLRWAYYTRDQIEYVPDALDPCYPHVLIVSFKHGENVIKHWWSATHYLRTVDDVPAYTDEEAKEYPGGAHGYGRIPFVIFRNDAAGRTFYGEPATDLVNANRTINHTTTALNWTMNFQGSSILLQIGGDPSKVLAVGPNSRVGLPENADLRFVTPDPGIDNAIAACNHNIALLCRSWGIPEDAFLLSRNGESGVAIVARHELLNDYREARNELFAPLEAELCALALMVVDGKEHDLPTVTYHQEMRPMSDAQLAELMWLKSINAISAVDVVLARNPGMSREDALEIIERNREEDGEDEIAPPKFQNDPNKKPPMKPDEMDDGTGGDDYGDA